MSATDTEVKKIIDAVIKREGGYVDHPNDKGGATNMGITIGTLSAWMGRPATKNEVKALTKEAAYSIYLQNYWAGPGIDRIPVCLETRINIFDAGVMSGPKTAIQRFQKAILAAGVLVETDGVLGPKTYRAALDAEAKVGAVALNNHYVRVRLQAVQTRIRQDRTQAVFELGWNTRIEKFRLASGAKTTPFGPKAVAQSTTNKAAAVSFLSGLGAQAADLAAAAQSQADILRPLVEFAPVLRWVFIGLMVVSAGFTLYHVATKRSREKEASQMAVE